jgi:hypothetical protein
MRIVVVNKTYQKCVCLGRDFIREPALLIEAIYLTSYNTGHLVGAGEGVGVL